MQGYATFKSHVLMRDEKGIFGIPFKRWLGSGLAGAVVMTLLKLPLPDHSAGVGLLAVLLALALTSPQGGVARWQRLLLSGQWQLRVALGTAPGSALGLLASALQLSTDPLDIDGAAFFAPGGAAAPRTQLTEWVSFLRPLDAATGDGLRFSRQPTLRLAHG